MSFVLRHTVAPGLTESKDVPSVALTFLKVQKSGKISLTALFNSQYTTSVLDVTCCQGIVAAKKH